MSFENPEAATRLFERGAEFDALLLTRPDLDDLLPEVATLVVLPLDDLPALQWALEHPPKDPEGTVVYVLLSGTAVTILTPSGPVLVEQRAA